MSRRPRTRVAISNGPAAIDGARSVDRYVRALDGSDRVGRVAFMARERDFIRDAKRFAQRRGIAYETWRDVGVPEAVLRSAEIALEAVPG